MEPIQINVSVKIDAGGQLLAAVQALTGKTPAAPPATARKAETQRPPQVIDPEIRPVKAEAAKVAPAPVEAGAAPDPSSAVPDAELRQAVKSARDRAGAKAVREVFAEFGIATSIECPLERRPELVSRLETLNA